MSVGDGSAAVCVCEWTIPGRNLAGVVGGDRQAEQVVRVDLVPVRRGPPCSASARSGGRDRGITAGDQRDRHQGGKTAVRAATPSHQVEEDLRAIYPCRYDPARGRSRRARSGRRRCGGSDIGGEAAGPVEASVIRASAARMLASPAAPYLARSADRLTMIALSACRAMAASIRPETTTQGVFDGTSVGGAHAPRRAWGAEQGHDRVVSLRALAHPIRLQMLSLLTGAPMSAPPRWPRARADPRQRQLSPAPAPARPASWSRRARRLSAAAGPSATATTWDAPGGHRVHPGGAGDLLSGCSPTSCSGAAPRTTPPPARPAPTPSCGWLPTTGRVPWTRSTTC